LLTARDFSGYADAIERLLAAPAERERLARAGRERVLSHHSWAGSMRRVDDLIAGVMDSRARMVG
jgi:glycosyltransferase involved in cell wall biosynthesis